MQHTLTRTVEAILDRAQADTAARTVPASLSSETPVRRFGENEVLSHEPGAIDLSRAAQGLPMLFNHDRALPIGVIEGIRIENRRMVGVLRFGTSAKADEVWRDVQAGVLASVSVTYSVDGTEPMPGGYRVTAWTPHEASIVSVPADPSVGIGRAAAPSTTHQGNRTVTTTETTQDRASNTGTTNTAADIVDLCQRHGLPQLAGQLIRDGHSTEQAGRAILDELARRDLSTGGRQNSTPDARTAAAAAAGSQRDLMIDALVERMGGRALENADVSGAQGRFPPAAHRINPYRHARVSDMARECLEVRGVRTGDLSPDRLVERALHATSDFPELLTGAGNRMLRQSYASYPGGLKRVFKASTARDFRAKSQLMLGEAPELLQVNEHGEYRRGTMAESKSTYTLATFGRIFGITRQALVNDDLDAFGSMTAKLGLAAAEFEAKALVALLTSNPIMADGNTVFHAIHGNLGTGAGSALQLSALTAARKAMRLMKGLDDKTPIDATPKYLIVPAALETTAEQLLADLQATAVTDVNPFSGRLDLVVDPRLDVTSSTAWYLAADANLIDTIEYAYLEGNAGPEVIAREGFEVDGMELKARLDYGCGVLDFRGMYRAAGV